MTTTATTAPTATTNGAGTNGHSTFNFSASLKTPVQVAGAKRRTYAELQHDLDEKAKLQPKDYLYQCINRNELGCAELLCAIALGDIAHDRASGEWYIFNGLHWEQDAGGNIFGLTGDVLSSLYRQTAAEKYQELLNYQAQIGSRKPTDDEKKQIDAIRERIQMAEKQAKELYKLAYIRNVLTFAGASNLLGVVGDEWDANHNLLGVNNGVIDLTTGKPVAPSPTQYIRTVAPVDYDPSAKCPTWERVINEIFNHDQEIIGYIRRLLGYAMSGTCYESDFFVWHGKDGRNGKEFLLERIRTVLGGNLAGVVEAELLLSSKSQRAKNSSTEALMALRGRRIAWASETNEGRLLDNASMKDLSGGHIMTGRHNHGRQEEWKRTHTLILLTNHKPHVGGGGGGAEWERIKLVNFTESFVSEPDPNDPHQHKKDPSLGDKIDKHEASGVFNWLLNGCLEWRKIGLDTPAAVKIATQQYRKDEDTLGRYIEDKCITDVNAKVAQADLYQEYKCWCVQNGDLPMGSKTFYGKIEGRGFARDRVAGVRLFKGIGLIVDPNRVILP